MESELDAGDMEITTNEAAAYLSGPVGFEVSAKFLRNLGYVSRGPEARLPPGLPEVDSGCVPP